MQQNGVFKMGRDVIQDLRERLVKVGQELYEHKLVSGTAGNISARIPGTNTILIKPSGVCMGSLKPEDFVIVDLEGKKVEGKLSLSLETPMHTAIYKVRSDVGGVAHTHSPVATAFGIAGIEILPMQVEMFLHIPKGVPIVPFEFPGSEELAEAVKRKIVEFNALLLENHGVVTVGPTIEEACTLNMMVEECAKIQFMTTMLAGREAISWENLRKKLKI
jgi:L-fuculose-phosphate aldolase